MKNFIIKFILLVSLTLLIFSSQAASLVWEDRYGPELIELSGDDDDETFIALSFAFPFNGQIYERIYIGNNGGLELGDLGNDNNIRRDDSFFMNQFLADGSPSIDFGTDFDLEVIGTMHFNDFGHKAVFTWLEAGQFDNELAASSFQIHLFNDGRIYFSFAGILDDPDEDMIEDMSEGIVLGISTGTNPENIDIIPQDLTQHFESGPTVFQRWCHDEADSCGFSDGGGLPGPINSEFNHDFTTITFTPKDGGFIVNDLIASNGFE